jgi:sigma-B regulation protein RsbQ
MDALRRNNVTISGLGSRTMVFSHGFGCDMTAWRDVSPAFEDDWRVVRFDHVGAGGSDARAYDPVKYGSLSGYADDVLTVLAALELQDAVFVGHSVAATIGMLAAIEQPRRFASLIMVCPSPCYIDHGDYVGGSTREDIEGLLEMLDRNFVAWSRATAPAIMGNPDRPELGTLLGDSFCRMDPEIARRFARVTFLSDHRADLPKLHTKALVLQARADVIAPVSVGEFVAANLPDSEYVLMRATGHCPHMSAPSETAGAIRRFVAA